MSTLLTANALRFSYGIRPAINGVSVSLAQGELAGLLGPNGSGKSTLIKLLLGQLRGEGDVIWEGKSIRRWHARDLARRIAYLPQNPTFDPAQTVSDAIRLGRAPYWGPFGIESTRDITVVRETITALELADLTDRPMDALSGGQRQRVFLGRCLAQEPAAMLLDEPNTFLDLRHQVDLCRLLRTLAHDRGIAILMASHDLNLAGAFADRLIVLHDGGMVADGTPDKVLQPELLEKVYGVPIRRMEQAGEAPVVAPVVKTT
jgi:iron complex transport system ATP-binding protein